MEYFDFESLRANETKAKKIYSDAAVGGYSIIKLITKKNGANTTSIKTFEVLKTPVNGRPGAPAEPFLSRGPVSFFPDQYKRRWGFVIDTPKNRETIQGLYVGGVVEIADANVKKQMEEEHLDKHNKVLRVNQIRSGTLTRIKSKKEQNLELDVRKKEDMLADREREMIKMQEEMEKLKAQVEKQKEQQAAIESEKQEKVDSEPEEVKPAARRGRKPKEA